MSLKLIVTKDGSLTIEGAGGVTYRSTFGALQESMHVFINAGLRAVAGHRRSSAASVAGQLQSADQTPSPLHVFEMGFGSGLNALLSLLEAADTGQPLVYETVETDPLPLDKARELNYCRLMGRPEWTPFFEMLHTAPWDQYVSIHPAFSIYKTRRDVKGYALQQRANLLYYDAFDPVTQPELWTPQVFESLYRQLHPGAVLVTYCSKGAVQRALRSAGFVVEKLPGPPGKREILRARKPADETAP